MTVLCDEAVERQIVGALRADDHDVLYVAELSPSIPDEEVLELAASEGSVLVTADKDFGELVYRQGRAHHGGACPITSRFLAAVIANREVWPAGTALAAEG